MYGHDPCDPSLPEAGDRAARPVAAVHIRHEAGTDTSQTVGYGLCVDRLTSRRPGETAYCRMQGVDEAARVLVRLERIQALDRRSAAPARIVGELRQLVLEAEAWARLEGDARACSAVGKLRQEAEGMS